MSSSLPGPTVVAYPLVPPPTATVVNVHADNPLELSNANSPHDTAYTIANGKTLRIQRVVLGAGHDPSERGTMVELLYYDGQADHVVGRFFVDIGMHDLSYADLSAARDGTVMTGDGANKKLKVRRTRLSSTAQLVDVHVQAFEE